MVEKLNKILIPLSIIVAGLIIAGAIVYINHDKGGTNQLTGGDQTNGQPSIPTGSTQRFSDCLDSGKFEKEVKSDYQEGQSAGVSGTPTFFINGEKLVGALPFSAFQTIIEKKLKEEPQSANVPIDGEPILGKADAPVTMIEFSDFQCPFCARYTSQTFPQIKKEYIDTGKVRAVFKNFPLPFHSDAQKAAEAGECAAEQGKFWEYKEKLFQNQSNLSVSDLKEYASELSLN